ncbi:MAG: ShlB/FhaC/HecB family hemolysin secretion/activation protein [Desulfococcaceae bacterium]|nr:ShlB/FhaC/HecB family hemolysin secretion/activation protein [Desulfococcaceae bacterium]
MQKLFFLILIMITLLLTGANALASGEETERQNHLPPPGKNLSSLGNVFVDHFVLEGNTVFSDEELSVITKYYENRKISAEELQDAARKLTEYYVNNTYVNSGAVIPDQKVKDGVIRIQIIEGKLIGTDVSGNTWLRDGYILKRLALATGGGKTPLNVNRIQERLKMLKQDPKIDNINANLKPGLVRGEAVLELEVTEARPYTMGLRFNNYNSPSIGAYRGELSLSHMNLSGWGDSLQLEYALTEGLDEYSAVYTIPLTRWGTTLGLEVRRTESAVKAAPFDVLEIESETDTLAAELRHPLYKSLSEELNLGLRFEKRKSQTSMINETGGRDGFGFSDGVEDDGSSRISVLRFSQEWIQRSIVQVIAARSSFGFGLDMLDATVNDEGADGEFFCWLGQFQYLRRLPFLDSQLLFRFDLRLSDDPLLPMEKFEIGGYSTVRGYRENQITTDNGLFTSLEWRIPAGHIKIPGLSKKTTDGLVQICPFYDFGKGWNTDTEDPAPDNLSSAGLGLRWTVSEKINAQIYWGYAFRDAETLPEHDLQDDGIHFEISAFIF